MVDVLWASVALAALAGWAVTLLIFTQALLPQANALKVLQQVDTFIDERIHKVVDRIEQRLREQRARVNPPAPSTPDLKRAADDTLRSIFGGAVDEPFPSSVEEQPDAEGIEIVDA